MATRQTCSFKSGAVLENSQGEKKATAVAQYYRMCPVDEEKVFSKLRQLVEHCTQPRSQGLSSLPTLSIRNDNGGREERP